MSPQLEDGYTRIAHEILTNTAKTKLNGTQFRIILIVWRYTYGFGRKETDLAVSFIAEALGIGIRPIQRELNKLIELGVITEIEAPTFNSSRVIAFNKQYRQEMPKKTPRVELELSTGDGLDVSTDVGLDTQDIYSKDNTKDTTPKNKYKDVFDYYLTLKLIKHKNYTQDMTDAMKKAEKDLTITQADMKIMLKRHSDKVLSSKNSEYKTKRRGLAEFFGQKKYQSKSLICVDYLDENYSEQKSSGIKINRNAPVVEG